MVIVAADQVSYTIELLLTTVTPNKEIFCKNVLMIPTVEV
jgi:hypothetical protein